MSAVSAWLYSLAQANASEYLDDNMQSVNILLDEDDLMS